MARKPVTVCDYPDGRIEIEYRGVILSYKTFDTIREVNRAEVVENKRLGPALELAAKMQAERETKRSKRTPRRRGQGEHMFSTPEAKCRFLNDPSVLVKAAILHAY